MLTIFNNFGNVGPKELKIHLKIQLTHSIKKKLEHMLCKQTHKQAPTEFVEAQKCPAMLPNVAHHWHALEQPYKYLTLTSLLL